MQPVIKWTGSKRLVAPELLNFLPEFKNYYEPFLGGGSLSYFQTGKNVFCSDVIEPLINIWTIIRDNPNDLYEEYSFHWANYQVLGKNYYYELRAQFNKTQNPFEFFFLTRLAVGGLIRFNKCGKFNSGLGYGQNGIQPKNLKPILFDWHQKIQGYEYTVAPYLEILPSKNSFVFCDPPYTVKNEMYFAGQFNYHLFYNWLESLSKRGVSWMVTTRDLLPRDLYKYSFCTSGGNSTFRQLTKRQKTVSESVYTNYLL